MAIEVRAGGSRLLLDCGVGGEGGEEWVGEVDELDGVWVSHAHLDHCGALPELLEGRPFLGGWASAATRRLMETTLPARDGVDAQRAADLADAIDPVPTRRFVDLGAGELRVMAFRAGHVLGARSLAVEIAGEPTHRLLYTGDFCCHDQPVVAGARLPATDAGFAIDTLVMEGVLATDRRADESDLEAEWGRFAAFADGPAGALVAVSPVGEAIEAVGALAGAESKVVVERSLRPVFEVYARSAGSDELVSDPSEGARYASEADLSAAVDAGATVVAPGDQLQPRTPAGRLARRILGREEARIAVLNRAYRSRFAGRLLEAEPGEEFSGPAGSASPLRASIEHFVVPNHAPRWQLVATVEALEPERVLLVHGRESHLQTLRRALGEAGYGGEVVVPANREAVVL